MKTQTREQLIEAFVYAESKIDYEKIHAHMVLTNWKWYGNENKYEIPSIQNLKDTVQKLFNTLAGFKHDKSTRVSMGGFQVNLWFWDNSIELEISFSISNFITSIC